MIRERIKLQTQKAAQIVPSKLNSNVVIIMVMTVKENTPVCTMVKHGNMENKVVKLKSQASRQPKIHISNGYIFRIALHLMLKERCGEGSAKTVRSRGPGGCMGRVS